MSLNISVLNFIVSKKEGEKEKIISQFLPILQEMCSFVTYCNGLVMNMIQQLSKVYSTQTNKKDSNTDLNAPFSNSHLSTIFKSLGDLLTILISLDRIILSNKYLLSSWDLYKGMIRYSFLILMIIRVDLYGKLSL